MHSCMSSAISLGEQGSAALFSRVLMLPVVASVITSLPWSRVSCDARPSGPWFHSRSPMCSPHAIVTAAESATLLREARARGEALKPVEKQLNSIVGRQAVGDGRDDEVWEGRQGTDKAS